MEILACGPGWLRRSLTPPPLAQLRGRGRAEAEISQGLREVPENGNGRAWPGAFWGVAVQLCLGLCALKAKRSGSVARVATGAGRLPGAWCGPRPCCPASTPTGEQRPFGVRAWRELAPGLSEATEPQGTLSAQEEQRWKGMSSA